MIKLKHFITAALLAATLYSVPAEAGIRIWPYRKKAAAVAAPADTTKKKTDYEKLFEKEQKACDGLFKVHLKDGKVYMEIPDSLLGREFLMGSTVKSISDNGNALVGSKNELLHFTFTKNGKSIQMRILDASYMSDDKNISQALALNSTGAVLGSYKIAAKNPDSTAVIDLTEVFLSDDKRLSPFVGLSTYQNYKSSQTFKKEASFIEDVKAFDDNVSVTSLLSYNFTLTNAQGKDVVKAQPFTAEVTRSIVMLPEKAYKPRINDPRIGYFWTEKQSFSTLSSSPRKVYLTNRWRLEPSDTTAFLRGELVEPIKPIVFYIDDNFPQWWKPYLHRAVEDWNLAFEKAGFKNAIKALDFPKDDPEFDPDNIKYSCIRYAPVGIQNAMGPSWVDPRSGEIINASVYVYHDVIQLISDWMFVQTSQTDSRVRTNSIPRDVLGEGLCYVIRHEVGHCLGLMHNMIASHNVPVEMLRDPEFTQENGTTYSIMDYARWNYVAQPGDMERGVKLTPPMLGKYDLYAIRWAYTPIIGKSFEQEKAMTKQWITDSIAADPIYVYGKQQLYSDFFDPRNQTEDLGDDIFKATEYGVSNLKYITANFMDWLSEDDPEYERRTDIYMDIVNQFYRYCGHLMGYVGGLYKNEVIDGDGRKPFENIPGDIQRKALKTVMSLCDDLSWISDKKVLGNLPVVGSPETSLREACWSQMFNAPYYAGRSDGVDTKQYSAQECLDDVFEYVWGPTRKGRKLTDVQRACQSSFIKSYMTMGGFQSYSDKAFAEDARPLEKSLCCFDSNCSEGIWYSPVSGFEWQPRAIFNRGALTAGDLYSVLMKARKLMQNAKAGASDLDKAHYELLIQKIDYSTTAK